MTKRKHSILGNIAFYLACIPGLALLLCPLAMCLAPSLAYFPSLLGFAFPILLLVCILFAGIYIALFQWVRALFFIVCILANYANIQAFVQLRGKGNSTERTTMSLLIESGEESRLKILSYNVHLLGYYNNPEDKTLRGQLIDFVNDADADVVCMQEYYERTDGSFPVGPQMLRRGYRYSTAPAAKSNFYYGNRIFSKYPIVNQGKVAGMPLFDAVYADILKGHDTLRVYNIHLASFRFDRSDDRFLSSLTSLKDNNSESYKEGSLRMLRKMKRATLQREKQLSRIMEHIAQGGSPRRVLVCGDMNDHPVSYAYRTFRKNDFSDAFVKAGRGFGQTYQGLYPSYRIDYIFLKGELKVEGFETHKVAYSDHRPVSAEIRL